jgi:hypothetical protein
MYVRCGRGDCGFMVFEPAVMSTSWSNLLVSLMMGNCFSIRLIANHFLPCLPNCNHVFAAFCKFFSALAASPCGDAKTFLAMRISFSHVGKWYKESRVAEAGLAGGSDWRIIHAAANDLALLKAEGKFSPFPVAASRGVKLGGTVVTVGFPNIGLQGFAPKLAKGEIASLSGAGDDARYFQISVSRQRGSNSGGALVDERGNVVGVVSAKLNARAALAASGSLPENVNYAVKSSYLLSFLESVPEVSAKLKEPNTKEQKFEDVVKAAEQAAVLVLVY